MCGQIFDRHIARNVAVCGKKGLIRVSDAGAVHRLHFPSRAPMKPDPLLEAWQVLFSSSSGFGSLYMNG